MRSVWIYLYAFSAFQGSNPKRAVRKTRDELQELARRIRFDLDAAREKTSQLVKALENPDEEPGTFECPRCNLDFRSAEKRDDHLSNVHGEGW